MNKYKLIIILLFGFGCSQAQQKPYYSQYIMNNYILNPALSGIENYTDLKFSYRNQWSGIDGAPVTMYMSVQGPINKQDYRTNPNSFQIPGENPRGAEYWQDYTAPQPHSGVGLIVLNDKTGYIDRTSVYGTFAYHKAVTTRTTLAMGFLGGFTNVSLDRSKIVWGSLDPNDPAIGYNDGELKKLTPELGAGLWLYSKDYFLGTSVLNVIPAKAKFVQTGNYGSYFSPQYFLTGGYRFLLGGDMTFLPSVLIQAVSSLPLQVGLNVKFQYQDQVWFGGGYRISDQLGGFYGMAGINISNTVNIGYSYDLSTTSALQTFTQGTNEIIIGFLINNKYGDSCPRNIW